MMDVWMSIMYDTPSVVREDSVGIELCLEGVVELVRIIVQPISNEAACSISRLPQTAQIRCIRGEAAHSDDK
jgi:hypothetical protein